jgi:hypothetical protein
MDYNEYREIVNSLIDRITESRKIGDDEKEYRLIGELSYAKIGRSWHIQNVLGIDLSEWEPICSDIDSLYCPFCGRLKSDCDGKCPTSRREEG